MDKHIEWRAIPGHEGLYEVSNHGDVRSLPREFTYSNGTMIVRPGRVLKPRSMVKGHLRVVLCDGVRQDMLVHRLVLMAFVGLPSEGQVGIHWNDVPDDNRIQNLRWGTRSDNAYDAIRNGLRPDFHKAHCLRGHEFTEENIYRHNNRRHCRICKARSEQPRKNQREKAMK